MVEAGGAGEGATGAAATGSGGGGGDAGGVGATGGSDATGIAWVGSYGDTTGIDCVVSVDEPVPRIDPQASQKTESPWFSTPQDEQITRSGYRRANLTTGAPHRRSGERHHSGHGRAR